MVPPRTLHRLVLPALAVLSVALVGCSSPAQSASTETGTPAATTAQAAPAAGTSGGAQAEVDVEATFGTTGDAITYNPELVPAGATAKVTSSTEGTSSTVTLAVTGLVPNRTYGSHAHQKPCGPAAADSGAHFQHVADPVNPSVDPAYANPQNEVWLDFTTDAQGAATITATQTEWAFTDQAAPQSVVIHAMRTATEPGKAGTAGDRVGCVTVDFA
ncbi:superoxide dismutase family protein [Pseudonocardia kujensis]|uniref:superoxide dismutase family protein n=1 Tax=Pseudonocardia kujensis TaxID=1128675 RepID=UPI001E32AE1C|nr:superoxide dismutase family protein [Pseudonocardia kujensis]MCE0767523.1 superoxide dismutase family protein [Pseudonocardia kujensis]